MLARYIVELEFETGETKVIDLEPFLDGPVFEPLLADYGLFASLRVDPAAGTVVTNRTGSLARGGLAGPRR